VIVELIDGDARKLFMAKAEIQYNQVEF